MTQKIWVVMQRDYEYNDETYESRDGGNTVVGYTNLADAQAECDKRNINTFRENGGYMYLGYDASDNFSETDELVAFLESLGDTEDDERGFSFDDLGDYYHFEEIMQYLKNATDEEIMVFVDALDNPEFFVETLEIAG